MTDYDTSVFASPRQVQAQEAFAIYADYDGNAPDTQDLLVCSTAELAEAVCKILNENPRKWGNLAFVDGWEHAKSFQFDKTLVPLDQEVPRSVADVLKNVETDDSGDEDE